MSETTTGRRPSKPGRRLPRLSSAQLQVFELERNALPLELQRYLSAVDEYRAAGSAPTWRPEVRP